MLCQNCQQRPANVHFTKIVNNTKVEMYLCEQCAAEKDQFGFDDNFSFSDFFTRLIGLGSSSPQHLATQRKNTVCDKCGMSFSEFQKIGKMGCSRCYEMFGEQMKPILKRLHGNMQHTGKVPSRIERKKSHEKEINELKKLLNEAIKNEEYEKAAEIRDRIKKLE